MQPAGQELYRENIPKNPVSTSATNNLIFLESFKYICMGVWIFVIYAFLHLILNNPLSDDVLIVLLCYSVCIIILPFVFGWILRDEIKSATPLVLYEDGIRVKRTILEQIVGRNEFLPRIDIKAIKVRRGMATQSKLWKPLGTWYDAPLEMTFELNDGGKYLTSQKLPLEIFNIVELIRSHWNLPIRDSGEGFGRFEPYAKKK